MSEAKFTPGEWTYEIQRFDCGNSHGMRVIVKCGKRDLFGVFSEREENFQTLEANAALIAAAPEMYQKLEWLFHEFDESDDEELVTIGWEIEKILKEARGEKC